jgi:homoserine O-succinyltransferase
MLPRRNQISGAGTFGLVHRLQREASNPLRHGGPSTRLEIALVNNMPDAALDATERQFRDLLGAAAEGVEVNLTLYTLPEVPRTEFGRRQVSRYPPFNSLWERQHDGVIVTGTEPHSADLKDEPYWGSLTRLLDWAERNTCSTILSCLAAHAGILYMDGISRRPLDQKRFGVFECARVADHPLTVDTPTLLQVPHSRWNEIPEEALRTRGYRVLTRSVEAGVDAFVKQRNSLFVFFQGHLEYDATSLLLEYRRDIGRYLRSERATYPPLPRGYFDDELVRLMEILEGRATADRRSELLAEFPTELAARRVGHSWRTSAETVYRNWLAYICHQKQSTPHQRIA